MRVNDHGGFTAGLKDEAILASDGHWTHWANSGVVINFQTTLSQIFNNRVSTVLTMGHALCQPQQRVLTLSLLRARSQKWMTRVRIASIAQEPHVKIHPKQKEIP